MPAASIASRTAVRSSGAAVTRKLEPSRSTSSAPPSAAASVSSSSSSRSASTRISSAPLEQPRDRAGAAEVAVVLREGGAHVGGGAVAVVGQRLDDHRDAVRAVALVDHLLERRRRRRPRPSRARSRARCCPSASSTSAPSRSRSASARFAAGSAPALAARPRSARATSFEKSLPRFASAAPFLCLIELPLAMPGHAPPPVRGRETARARRVSPVSSGWNDGDEHAAVAQQHRLAVELGQHLDARPRPRATRGARMKTPRSGSSRPPSSRSASKLATWRP